MTQFQRLVGLMARLRSPDGCPWDREQTHQTLKPFLIEETYEVLDAIDTGGDRELKEELGDLLLQVVFHAQLAYEDRRFSIEDVAAAISDKLLRRHPHVFGDVTAENAEQVLKNWEAIKTEERREKGDQAPSALEGIPRQLPALLRSERLQDKAARAGFDWSDREDVAEKTREEVEEFLTAYRSGDADNIENELGDFLFSIVNLARYLNVSPEDALSRTNRKFDARFRYIERKLAGQNRDLGGATAEEIDALWEEAKTNGIE